MRFGEMLNPDGTMYTTNLRSAHATDTYICRGGGKVETWEPHFTFHGFRYVEVTGYPGMPGQDAITGCVVGSDTPMPGRSPAPTRWSTSFSATSSGASAATS